MRLGAIECVRHQVIVSRMRYIATKTNASIRIVGLSTAMANAHDLADWLGIPPDGLFNFKPSVTNRSSLIRVRVASLIRRVLPPLLGTPGAARGAHRGLPWQALLPPHDHNEQAHVPRDPQSLAYKAGARLRLVSSPGLSALRLHS